MELFQWFRKLPFANGAKNPITGMGLEMPLGSVVWNLSSDGQICLLKYIAKTDMFYRAFFDKIDI